MRFLVSILVWVLPLVAWSYPQHALRHRINRCTACHVSPSGGGHLNVSGKAYGSRGHKITPWQSQDEFYGDARMVYYKPERKDDSGGANVMAGYVGLNLPVTPETKHQESELRFVFTHNMGGFSQADNSDLYLRYQSEGINPTSWAPQFWVVGRFHPPFGMLTDEHRVYTRIQTETTWNDYEMGFMASANPYESFHYDLAVVNGENVGSSAANYSSGRADRWGTTLNLRYMPAWGPLFFGLSGSYHDRGEGNKDPYRGAFYTGLALDRMTNNYLKGTWVAEVVSARYWNQNNRLLDGRYGPKTPSGYMDSVADSTSLGYYTQIDYYLTQHVALLYRFEELILDRDFTGDNFIRHGLGFKFYPWSNVIAQMRFEQAEAGREEQDEEGGLLASDAYFGLLQYKF